jgi:hypothetical protein
METPFIGEHLCGIHTIAGAPARRQCSIHHTAMIHAPGIKLHLVRPNSAACLRLGEILSIMRLESSSFR